MLMEQANNNQKEKVTGIWSETGEEVTFNRVWAGYRFSDSEIQDLLNGKQIEIRNLKSKKGTAYGVIGKLAEQTYDGNSFIGFMKEEFIHEEGVPGSWCKHNFTEKEKKALEAGETVHIKNAVSKNGKKFECDVKYDLREDGNKGIIPMF